jgi:hypothetical protein
MEHWWNDTDGGKTELLAEKPVPVLRGALQIPHGLAWDRVCVIFKGEARTAQ